MRMRARIRHTVALLALATTSFAGTAHAAEQIGAVGVNDLRSDGIFLSHGAWAGDGDLALAHDGGIRLYRARMRLDCVDPEGRGDFDFARRSPTCWLLSYDDLVRGLTRHGMTLLPALINFGMRSNGHHGPVPPTQDGAGGTPTRERFAAFAAAAARRYGPDGTFWDTCGCDPKPIRAWEIWNEQNNGWWWDDAADAEDYAALFTLTRAKLREADPRARAVVGGLVWDRNGEQSFVEPAEVLRALAVRDVNAFDAVAIHPYSDARGRTGEQLGADAVAFVDRIADDLRATTGTGPGGAPRQQIWLTEMGWSDTDAAPETIAEGFRSFSARLDAGVRAADNVGPVLWYMLRDNNVRAVRDDGLGLRYTHVTGADAGPKPAWTSLTRAAAGGRMLDLPAALELSGVRYSPDAAASPSGGSAVKSSALRTPASKLPAARAPSPARRAPSAVSRRPPRVANWGTARKPARKKKSRRSKTRRSVTAACRAVKVTSKARTASRRSSKAATRALRVCGGASIPLSARVAAGAK